jgi:hypothetical protein
MKNSNENQNEEVETMSFSDFLLELPIRIILLFFAGLWAIAMGILLIYIKYVR